MDLDPTTVTLALTTLASMAGNVLQTRRLNAEKAKNESAAKADDASAEKTATTAAADAYRDARGDLHDCRDEVAALKAQNATQASQITALESSQVLLTNGFANLAQKHEGCERNVNGLRAEIEELRRSLT